MPYVDITVDTLNYFEIGVVQQENIMNMSLQKNSQEP